ncbi:MAG: tRNA pseudouridine(55) synthase TruB [bacterium]
MPAEYGVLVVDKPTRCTSHDVVGRARKDRGLRRVGHAGTLDPDASGVLVLGLGPATRLLGYLSGADKDYETTIVLGCATTTDDAAGDVIARANAAGIGLREVSDVAARLTGDILQRPSAVSAVKVSGKRAYDRVRSGEQVVLEPRPVHVERFEVLDIAPVGDDPSLAAVRARVTCSAGTYVRALARDLGADLGVGGHVRSLRRTRSGAFTASEAVGFDAIAGAPLVSAAEAARRSLPWAEVSPEDVALIRNGVRVAWPGPDGPEEEDRDSPEEVTAFALLCGDDLAAVARRAEGRAHYLAVFPPP